MPITSKKVKLGKIFISYRRNDSAVFSHRLFDKLAYTYGRSQIMFDVDSIPSGTEFRNYLVDAVRHCRVFIPVIGENWVDLKDGISRLQSDGDYVRIEIEEALNRKDRLKILPILLGKARFPERNLVPESIADLRYVNSISVDPAKDFNSHVKRVIKDIDVSLYGNGIYLWYSRFFRLINRFFWQVFSFLFLITTSLAITFPPLQVIRHGLMEVDTSVFLTKDEAPIDVARGIPGREALEKETDTGDIILGTRHSFDFFAEHGSFVPLWKDQILSIVRSGARVRVLLIDNYSPNNVNANVKPVTASAGQNQLTRSAYLAETVPNWGAIENLQDQISLMPKTKGGSFEFRIVNKVFKNSIWVRDGRDPDNAVSHIQISFYGDDRQYPVVRFGKASPRMNIMVQSEFDELWAQSYAPPRLL